MGDEIRFLSLVPVERYWFLFSNKTIPHGMVKVVQVFTD